MTKDLDVWYRQYEACATIKGPPNRPHGRLQKVIAGEPMDLVAIDILSGPPLHQTNQSVSWSQPTV